MFKPGREGDGMREERRAPEKEAAELRSLLFEQEGDFGYETEFCGDEDDEGPFESLLRHAPEIEAGLRDKCVAGWHATPELKCR